MGKAWQLVLEQECEVQDRMRKENPVLWYRGQRRAEWGRLIKQ
jgi:hypothetical protein